MVDEPGPEIEDHPDLDTVHVPARAALDLRAFRAREIGELQPADPGEIDGLEFAYLSGAEGPQVESRSGWDVDGVEIRVILDFGAGFIDHRGWFMNAGA